MKAKKIAVIGGGFFGMYISEYFAKKGNNVVLYEKENNFMTHASSNNQARIHNGYHYPRSILTALRSRISFPKFFNEYKETIDKSFESYYLIGKILSKVNSTKFKKFCERIGAPCSVASDEIKRLINFNYVEEVYLTKEFAFDAIKLKHIMKKRIDVAGVKSFTNRTVQSVNQYNNSIQLEIYNNEADSVENFLVDHTFNCTYSMLNYVLVKGNLERIPLKHELTEICLIKAPLELQKKAITVMCGPFFSVMPFPSRNGVHSLSHVRYTPHYEWFENSNSNYINPYKYLQKIGDYSNFNKMIYDASRYIPVLKDSSFVESIFEVKTLLPQSEIDDSRPILFTPNQNGLKGFHSILGGKIDNIYDIIDSIERIKLV